MPAGTVQMIASVVLGDCLRRTLAVAYILTGSGDCGGATSGAGMEGARAPVEGAEGLDVEGEWPPEFSQPSARTPSTIHPKVARLPMIPPAGRERRGWKQPARESSGSARSLVGEPACKAITASMFDAAFGSGAAGLSLDQVVDPHEGVMPLGRLVGSCRIGILLQVEPIAGRAFAEAGRRKEITDGVSLKSRSWLGGIAGGH